MFLRKCIRNILNKRKLNALRNVVINSHHDKFNYDKNVADYRNKGFSLSESAIYNFPKNNYKDYITTWESYQPRIKNNPYSMLSDNKYLFSIVFGKHIKTAKVFAIIRDGNLVPTEDNSICKENIYDFILQSGGMVIKDTFGSDGFEVFVLHAKNGKITYKNNEISKLDLEKIITGFKEGVIQELLEQGEFENNIFSESINTVRVISMRKKGLDEHEIIAALQRIGNKKSAPVDNFNQGGGSALIDIKTGRIGKMTSAFSVDDSGNRIFYDTHPDTGAVINGAYIPNWNKLQDVISEVTKRIPFFDYIAWDIVVQDDGFALIETNLKSSLNVFQIHEGMRNSFLGDKYREYGFLQK